MLVVVLTVVLLSLFSSLSAAGVGFILVIDRRQDRWAAVKGTLLRIAVSNHACVFLASVSVPLCVCE